ncbi:hypothetical protein BH10PSE13_BH10PSE13_07840 [soil metagenome]
MRRRPNWRLLALAATVAIVAFCVWNWSGWQRRAWIAAGFGARVACSCRQVEGRAMASCRKDFRALKGMGLVTITDRADGMGVDASVPLLAHRTARIVPGFGCIIDNRQK